MNNLGWIDKQILLVKENIQYHKDLLDESEEEYVDEILSAIKLLEPELQTLEQIKSELEAWEEIKKYLVLNEGCIYEDSYYEYLTLQNDCIDETESEEQGVSLEIIKKALEVEDVINM